MLEELCSSALWNACCAIRDRTPLVRLRGSNARTKDLWDGFFREADFHTRFDILPPIGGRGGLLNARKGDIRRASWAWFYEHSERIVDGYIKERYGNDLRKAMSESGTYNRLHAEYLEYFADRREKFMDEMKNALEVTKAKLAKQGKAPASHGGVANLLKVLTKTMQSQGASILSIAKVQYAVCIQAGILLPSEFLTDVLVAGDIIGGDS